jgi:UDP-N-acetylglucosamine 2-epimerase (non-hydrolysing)
MTTILCVIGTRPEAIKMLPVIYALKKNPQFHCRIVSTAQHRGMLDQVLDLFEIKADVDLDLMRDNQPLNALTGRMLLALDPILAEEKPDAVLAQGDTTTVFASALSAFHHQIPFGHVEAGLRTGNPYSPFPEEMNRLLTSKMATWHFAPTETAFTHLISEGIAKDAIFLTGNTIIDMVRLIADKKATLPEKHDPSKRLIFVTAHRRENFGQPLQSIFRAIRSLADRYTDIQFLYPVHPNPNVTEAARLFLSEHPRIILCEPLDYITCLTAMRQAFFIMSDSGGIQEEAIALDKHMLLLREDTERPEGSALGYVTPVGHDYSKIIQQAAIFLDNPTKQPLENPGALPYGNGFAADQMVSILHKHFNLHKNHALA